MPQKFKLTIRSFYLILILITSIFFNSSCISTKKVNYFNGITEGTITNTSNTSSLEPIIQKNDILSILVTSPSTDPEATAMFNPQVSVGTYNQQINTGQSSNTGYLVNIDGNIQFPILGLLKADGLTKAQLELQIATLLTDKKLLVSPIVTVRFLNFRVTILGEVGKPSVVTTPSEKLSLLEALGLAGDLTIYGNRKNILLIREDKAQKIVKRIDINSTELLSSPYYYLKSGDIIIVEPTKNKLASVSRSNAWLPIMFGALSFATIVADRIIR